MMIVLVLMITIQNYHHEGAGLLHLVGEDLYNSLYCARGSTSGESTVCAESLCETFAPFAFSAVGIGAAPKRFNRQDAEALGGA